MLELFLGEDSSILLISIQPGKSQHPVQMSDGKPKNKLYPLQEATMSDFL